MTDASKTTRTLSEPPMRAGCPHPAMCDELMVCTGQCCDGSDDDEGDGEDGE